jgi:hypothetical protein
VSRYSIEYITQSTSYDVSTRCPVAYGKVRPTSAVPVTLANGGKAAKLNRLPCRLPTIYWPRALPFYGQQRMSEPQLPAHGGALVRRSLPHTSNSSSRELLLPNSMPALRRSVYTDATSTSGTHCGFVSATVPAETPKISNPHSQLLLSTKTRIPPSGILLFSLWG